MECSLPVVDWFLGRAVYLFVLGSIAATGIAIYMFAQKKMKMEEQLTSARNQRFYSSDWGDNVFDISNRLDLVHDKRVKEAKMKAKHKKQLRIVRTQADLYIGGVIVCSFATIALRFIVGDSDGDSFSKEMQIPHDHFTLMVLQAILFPLQGFVSMLFYMRPRYFKNRTDYPDEGGWWAFRRCVYGDQVQPLKADEKEKVTTATQIRVHGKGATFSESSSPAVHVRSRTIIDDTELYCKVGSKVQEDVSEPLKNQVPLEADRLSAVNATTVLMDGSLRTRPTNNYGW